MANFLLSKILQVELAQISGPWNSAKIVSSSAFPQQKHFFDWHRRKWIISLWSYLLSWFYCLLNTDYLKMYENKLLENFISPMACGLWWNVYFHHDLPGSHKNSPIFNTATPPRSHNQNLFCVGSDGYIRAQCGSAHPSTHGYMILATSNPHSSPRVQTNLCKRPNPHKSLQNLENHNVYSESNISFEYISWQNPNSVLWWMHLIDSDIYHVQNVTHVLNAEYFQWRIQVPLPVVNKEQNDHNKRPELWIYSKNDSNTTYLVNESQL